MFKCFDSARQVPVIILDAEWQGERLEGLRAKGRDGLLLCPQCREPVRVRAGLRKAWHFAHRSLGNCAMQAESPELLQARSQLYAWLQSVLTGSGATVTLEEKIDDQLPRPVDCLVAYPGGPTVAFWLTEKGMRERDTFRACFQTAKVKLNVIFLSGMLRPLQNSQGMFYEPGAVNLSVTEREFMYRSGVMADLHGMHGDNLHYLDPETGRVTSLRALNLVHEPGIFKAEKVLNDPLESLRLVRTRLLVHPSEAEGIGSAMEASRLREERRRQEQLRREQEAAQLEVERQQAEEEQRKREAQWREEAEKQRLEDERRQRLAGKDREKQETVERKEPVLREQNSGYGVPQAPAWMEKDLVCTGCGQKTHDWVNALPAKGTCLCRPCYDIREKERLRRLREQV